MAMLVKLLIGLLIIACIAPLFIKGPDGEPIMDISDWKPDFLEGDQSLPVPSEPTTVYKWQDEEGQWHFSDAPPPDLPVEEMELTGDINLMPAPPPPTSGETAAADPGSLRMPTGPMSATPDQVKEIMETVTELQETLDAREESINEAVAPNG